MAIYKISQKHTIELECEVEADSFEEAAENVAKEETCTGWQYVYETLKADRHSPLSITDEDGNLRYLELPSVLNMLLLQVIQGGK